jgi:hypothetical protein
MPRANRRRRDEAPLDLARARAGGVRLEHLPDGDWHVRSVTSPTKAYRCPGCDHEIPSGETHIVAWPVEGTAYGADGVAARRHWHRGCWSARARRGR